ncbi:MAG: hypothetical protein V1835_07435, partial [Candidatus Micrarchaeota archaeon]
MVLEDTYASLEEAYYGLMDYFENHGIPVYESFINPVEDQGRPSFPIFMLLLILIILFLGGGVFLFMQSTGSVELNVMVLANGDPLKGSKVSLFWNGKTKISTTDTKGMVVFTGLKSGDKVVVKAAYSGYTSKFSSATIEKGKVVKIDLSTAEENILTVKVVNADLAPISGALIDFGTGSTYTDGSGTANISVFTSGSISLAVSKSGYKDAQKSIPEGTKSTVVVLEALSGDEGGIRPEKAHLVVNVVDEQGKPLTAQIKICLASSTCKTPIIRNAAGGEYESSDFGTGSSLKITASASGYSPRTKEVTLESATEIEIQLFPSGTQPRNQTLFSNITIFDNATRNPAPAKITVFDSHSDIVFETPSPRTSEIFELEVGDYFALAEADDYVFGESSTFHAGDNVAIYLLKKTVNNTKNITINTLNESSFPVLAELFFYDLNNSIVPPFGLQTNNNGTIFIAGVPIREYILRAENLDGLSGQMNIDLRYNSIFNVTLHVPAGTLRATARENNTNALLTSFAITAMNIKDLSVLRKQCSVNPCDMQLPSYRNYSVSVNATNYLPASMNLGSDEIRPLNMTNKTFVLVFNSSGMEIRVTNASNIFSCPKLVAVFSANGIQTNCDTLVMKVDPIFPADAIPLEISGIPSGTYNFEFSDESGHSNDELKGCFDFSTIPAGPALRYNPSKPNCPREYRANGNTISSANFTLQLTNIPATLSRAIKLVVWNETDLSFVPSAAQDMNAVASAIKLRALDASYIPYKKYYQFVAGIYSYQLNPLSYYGRDDETYSPYKAAYVLNNRQLEAYDDIIKIGGYGKSGTWIDGMAKNILAQNQNKGAAVVLDWDSLGGLDSVFANPPGCTSSMVPEAGCYQPVAIATLTPFILTPSISRLIETYSIIKSNFQASPCPTFDYQCAGNALLKWRINVTGYA